jgi:hypothetical protein
VLFSYFYTSIIFNSVDLSENLKKQGAFIPGVKPGSATADYIDGVLGRITLPGSLFLALIAIIPILVAEAIGVFAVPVRWHLDPDRRRRPARHDLPGRTAPDAPQVRRLHEVGSRQVPRPPEQVRDVRTRTNVAVTQGER